MFLIIDFMVLQLFNSAKIPRMTYIIHELIMAEIMLELA